MTSAANPSPFVEIELKLALPTAEPGTLAQRLAHTPLLARRKATRLQLDNVYYDTPDQRLKRERIALRTRHVGGGSGAQWLQTLKMAGRGDSALSSRGEWESEVPDAALSLPPLHNTPWTTLDPDGALFARLQPAFATHFERTLWTVRRRNGSVVEIALDLGEVIAGGQRAPLAELELELKAGPPEALFDLAQELARTLAVLPVSLSKAQRGDALAQGTLNQPRRAQPPALSRHQPLAAAAQQVLREAFDQFTANLDALCRDDHPELVHQARVGWRRFQTALRLFKPVLPATGRPHARALKPLLHALGRVRDLDVARLDTLAPLAYAYIATSEPRAATWQAMMLTLSQSAGQERQAVRAALQTPAVGATLLAFTHWLENLWQPDAPATPTDTDMPEQPLRAWARRRVARQHQRLKQAGQSAEQPTQLHRLRIQAKRLRYAIEALRPLLPRRRALRWHAHASDLQTRLGATRDLAQAHALLAPLDVAPDLVAFLRGVAVGQQTSQAPGDGGRA